MCMMCLELPHRGLALHSQYYYQSANISGFVFRFVGCFTSISLKVDFNTIASSLPKGEDE